MGGAGVGLGRIQAEGIEVFAMQIMERMRKMANGPNLEIFTLVLVAVAMTGCASSGGAGGIGYKIGKLSYIPFSETPFTEGLSGAKDVKIFVGPVADRRGVEEKYIASHSMYRLELEEPVAKSTRDALISGLKQLGLAVVADRGQADASIEAEVVQIDTILKQASYGIFSESSFVLGVKLLDNSTNQSAWLGEVDGRAAQMPKVMWADGVATVTSKALSQAIEKLARTDTFVDGLAYMSSSRAKVAEQVPDEKYDNLAAGIQAFKQEDYEKALKIFKGIAKSDSADWRAHYWLGCTFNKLSEYDQAIENFKISNQLSQQYGNYEGLVRAYLAKEQYEDSLFFFKRYADLKAENVYPYDGFIHLANGDFTEAKLALDQKKLVGIETRSAPEGIAIISVHKNSPAAVAGLRANDVIVKFNDHGLQEVSPQEFVAMVQECRWGDTASIIFLREDRIHQGEIILGITDELIAKIAMGNQYQEGQIAKERVKEEEPVIERPRIIEGEVVEIYQGRVKIKYSGDYAPTAGDSVQIGFKIDDDIIEVDGDWRIVEVNSGSIPCFLTIIYNQFDFGRSSFF